MCRSLVVLILGSLLLAASPAVGQQAAPLDPSVKEQLTRELASVGDALAQFKKAGKDVADAEVFHKGVTWALRYDPEFTPADVALLKRGLERTRERLAALKESRPAWPRSGKQALGYVSSVDGSVQPYGLVVPRSFDRDVLEQRRKQGPHRPLRLDVVLHGSTKPVGMSELRFMGRFDEGDGASPNVSDQPYLELHPLGRVENCYRWAGETDVFEAIEDVKKRFGGGSWQVVLRGMSMGASGTWHLGLKHPLRFHALGPYCGYVDTHRFSETPLPTFIKVGPLPEHQERGLHILDSIDYAANAGVIPVVACMGEKDVFFQAHVLMTDAMKKEGLILTNLISPGTGHVVDPVTHAEQMRQIGEALAVSPDSRPQMTARPTFGTRGQRTPPDKFRFVTWSLKYSNCGWLQILGLEEHYRRAEVSVEYVDGHLKIAEPVNVTRLAIHLEEVPRRKPISMLADWPWKTFRVGDDEPLATQQPRRFGRIVFEKKDGHWRHAEDVLTADKRPGVQGPIDDAFATRFLCVRGTGTPWNAAVHKAAHARLDQFASEWHHYFRGELPLKNDVDVTEEDARTSNLILFGDPGSNSEIARVLPRLPLEWTRETLTFNGQAYPASTHLPALIFGNPFEDGRDRYVVLNTGHTFGEAELSKLNYLLFPRWGDWAILQLSPADGPLTVLKAGYFQEDWRTVLPLR